ncbi:MAG: hypothetical protein L3J71_07255 [Victivallaceae bacterium]|nr:hypothetical protein [Victivallaceae bacterium]
MNKNQITISESVYERLKQLADPFEDTPETVILNLLDFYDNISNIPEISTILKGISDDIHEITAGVAKANATVISINERMAAILDNTNNGCQKNTETAAEKSNTFSAINGTSEDYQKSTVEISQKITIPEHGENEPTIKKFNPAKPPKLAFTKIISAQIDGKIATGWNELVAIVHEIALSSGLTKKDLSMQSLSKIFDGEYTEDGYRYIKAIDMSIQNVSSDFAWRNAYYLANEIGKIIEITFKWRDDNRASFPGSIAMFTKDV